jgi:hypothetical protein
MHAGGSQLPDQTLLELARDARARAEEVRSRAETFDDARVKQELLEIAAEYNKLAERLEQAAEP